MLEQRPLTIHGDGSTTRDFCYIDNVVEANLLAATVADADALGQVYNVAVGDRMSLDELYRTLRDLIAERHPGLRIPAPLYTDFRAGDVRHSEADIGKARRLLGYIPAWDARQGLAAALPWYEKFAAMGSPDAKVNVRRAV
jgi:UDP-N-acetylglucosamine 4-epimerase